MKYVTYLRVSTVKQGNSKNGLNVQRQILNNFIKDEDIVVKEYVEIESGRKPDRPKLHKALELAKAQGAILLIAKLDRLARSVSFISNLMDSDVEFKAVDLPEANRFTLHLMASLAEMEARLISERTKQSLAQLVKHKKVKLGKPENLTLEAIAKGRKAMQENAFNDPVNQKAGHVIVLLRKEGNSFYKIAKYLNDLGYRTRRGNLFSIAGTRQLFNRYQEHFKI